MNIRRSIAAVGTAGALMTGSVLVGSPAQAQPVITGGLVNVTVVDLITLEDVNVLQNVGVGVAANVLANVCGVRVNAAVLAIVEGIADEAPVTCTNEAGTQEVTIDQQGE